MRQPLKLVKLHMNKCSCYNILLCWESYLLGTYFSNWSYFYCNHELLIIIYWLSVRERTRLNHFILLNYLLKD